MLDQDHLFQQSLRTPGFCLGCGQPEDMHQKPFKVRTERTILTEHDTRLQQKVFTAMPGSWVHKAFRGEGGQVKRIVVTLKSGDVEAYERVEDSENDVL